MNGETKGFWKEAIVGYFKILSLYMLRKIEENHESSQPGHAVTDNGTGQLPNEGTESYR
jgi:hypothetical protein